ncbi:MAG: pilus assembly protein [Anaerolineales bacterium]|nr:pilus assembly protein [Anaerolineales bacterium]
MLYQMKESGQGLIEYALILVLIAVAVIAALLALGVEMDALYGQLELYFPLHELGRNFQG